MLENKTSTTGNSLLDEVLADYLKAVDAGSAPDRTAIMARHPELRPELEAFFAAEENVDRWTGPLRELCATPSTVNEQRTVAGDDPGPASPQETGVCGDYELLAEIARGGMGIVYRARQKRLGRVVALKMILAGNLASAAEVQRFRSEAQAAARLDHPHIVPIYEVGEHDGRHFFTMKLIEGDNLAQRAGNGQWPADSRAAQRSTAALIAKVARAVHYAHQHGIMHRDLKPANILLDDKNEPHVTDFGLAKRVGDVEQDGTIAPALTQTGAILGTPSYMAPEQASGAQALTTAVDTYSLGSILFELLTGRPPFRGETPIDTVFQVREREAPRPRALNPALDYELETICLKCLEKDPRKRYDSPQALADDLERWLADEPILGRRAGHWERTRKWVRRHPAVSALLGTTGVAAASLLILAGFLWHNAELRAEAVQNLDQARQDLHAARTEQVAAGDNVQRLQRQAEVEQAKLDKLQKLADQQRALAETARREATHVLYAADMQFAHAAWQAADMTRFRRLLENHQPAKGATDLRGFEWHYLAGLGGQAKLTLKGHAESSKTPGHGIVVALSADGKRLASAGADRKVLIWDTDTGKLLHTREGPPHPVGVAFTPQGDKVHVAAAVVDGKPLGANQGFFDPKDLFKNQISSPSVSVSANLMLQIVDLNNPAESKPDKLAAAELPAPASLIAMGLAGGSLKRMIWLPGMRIFMPMSFALSSDRKTLAAAGFTTAVKLEGGVPGQVRQEGMVLLWDLEQDREKATYQGHPGIISSAAYSPQGVLATAAFDRGTIILWGDDGKPRLTLAGHRGPVITLTFSSDGKQLFSGAIDGTINMWDVVEAKLLQTLHGHRQAVSGLALAGDGRRLISAGMDGLIKVWDLETAFGPAPLTIPVAVSALTFADQGRALFTLDRSGTLTKAEAGTGKVLSRRQVMGGKPLTFASFSVVAAVSPEGTHVAHPDSIQGKARVVLRETEGGKELRSFDGVAHALSFSADGRRLALGLSPGGQKLGDVTVWDIAAGQEVLRFKDFGASALAFSADGTRLAAGSRDRSAEVWDIASAQRLLRLERSHPVRAVAFSPDGKLLAAGGADMISIHDAVTGKEVRVFPTFSHSVAGLVFSPDGKRLASAGSFGESLTGTGLKLWDTATGRETITLGDPYAAVGAVAFSPDGTRLAAALFAEQGILNNFRNASGGKSVVHVWEAGR